MRVSSPVLGGLLRRRVIVTGGASGFGEATVRWMVSRGAKVVIADVVSLGRAKLRVVVKRRLFRMKIEERASWSRSSERN